MLLKDVPLIRLEDLASKRLAKGAFDYIAGGAGAEFALRRNIEAFSDYQIIPRCLRDVSKINLQRWLPGVGEVNPIVVAPTAFHELVSSDGECATAAAAAKQNTVMCVSTMSTQPLEKIIRFNPNCWFQLYVYRNTEITKSLIRRAEVAGYKAIVITVDVPVMGRRHRDAENNFSLPEEIRAANLFDKYMQQTLHDKGMGSSVKEFTDAQFDPGLTWEKVANIKAMTHLPIILKGVLSVADAQLAIDLGVAAIVVSNHGGRQLDQVPAGMDVLADICEVVDGRIPVLLDGGVRSGEDVFKALALGASAVMVGRPILWGLALDGGDGVREVLSTLAKELLHTMQLAGCRSLSELKNQEFPWLCGVGVERRNHKKLLCMLERLLKNGVYEDAERRACDPRFLRARL